MTSPANRRNQTTFCYMIMCHTDPEGVLRLVRRIKALSPTSSVIVRHDAEDLLTTEQVVAAGGMHLTSAIPVKWAAWSVVEAEMELMHHSLRRTQASHFVLLSGQDYPIVDLAQWEREVVATGADVLMEPMDPTPDDHEYSWTVRKELAPMPKVMRFGVRVVTRAHRMIRPRGRDAYWVYRGGEHRWWFRAPRKHPAPVAPRKYGQWMAFTRKAGESIASRDRLLEYRNFFRTVRAPDEYYMPSLMLADPGLNVLEVPVTATRFEEGAASPVWIDEDELRRHADSGVAFVRKMPPDVSPAVLEAADALADRTHRAILPLGSGGISNEQGASTEKTRNANGVGPANGSAVT